MFHRLFIHATWISPPIEVDVVGKFGHGLNHVLGHADLTEFGRQAHIFVELINQLDGAFGTLADRAVVVWQPQRLADALAGFVSDARDEDSMDVVVMFERAQRNGVLTRV